MRSRTRARRNADAARRPAACCRRRQCPRPRPYLSEELRAGSAWASSEIDVIAPRSLIQLANHFIGTQVLARPEPAVRAIGPAMPDLRDIKGQESAKRALEIAAAGGHNLLNGPPGAGKSMLAARLPSILPPLSPRELLDVSMIHSVAGAFAGGELTDRRPFRAPQSLRFDGGFGRRRPACAAGRSVARPPRRALSRRIAGILTASARFVATAARD